MQNELKNIMGKICPSDQGSLVQNIGKIIEQYPYFSTARLLYLRELKQSKSHQYKHELGICSAYAANRKVLSSFIDSEYKFDIPKNTQNQRKIEPKKEKISNTKPKKKKPTFDIQEEYPFSEWIDFSTGRKAEGIAQVKKKRTPPNKKFELINKFIDSNITLKPGKDYTNGKAVDNIDQTDNDDLMTDTLAQIYIEQKKYVKALKAYQILSLKYPEKKTYFTEKIKYIKTKQSEK